MIIRLKEVYERAATKLNLAPELVSSVGDMVLDDLKDEFQYPNSIGYKLPKFGVFSLRFNNFKRSYKIFRNKRDWQDIIDQMKDYTEKKKYVKRLRQEYGWEEEIQESS